MGELMEWEMWDRAGELESFWSARCVRGSWRKLEGGVCFLLVFCFFYFMKMAWRNLICDSSFYFLLSLLPSSFLRKKKHVFILAYHTIPYLLFFFEEKGKKIFKNSKNAGNRAIIALSLCKAFIDETLSPAGISPPG